MGATIGDVTPGTGDGYHHGDLPNALRRAATDVIGERGLGGFSLREVARRAGVSHTAPAHHFGDVRGLLTSIAEEGFVLLHDASEAAVAAVDDPVERLAALGEAYVGMARSHPAHCEVMFRTDLVDENDAGVLTCGLEAYGVLERTVQQLIEAEQLDVELDDAAWLCWSAVQGLVVLEPKIKIMNALKGGSETSTADIVRRFTDLMVNGIRGCR